MPTLPSGRRVEFSLDRFHALLERLGRQQARRLVGTLNDADDLLFVLDAVHFGAEDGAAYFAGYVAADWLVYAADWHSADRLALQAWFASPAAREARADAVEYLRSLYGDDRPNPAPYPYLFQNEQHRLGHVTASPPLQ